MTGKKLNIIIFVSILVFSLIWGFFSVFKFNTMKNMDASHDNFYESEREQEKEENKNDIIISDNNENLNDPNQTVPGTGGGNGSGTNVDISKFNFAQMYEHAEKKLNSATNVLSNGSGTATISGPTSKNITLNNEKVKIEFSRAQNISQKFFKFRVYGPLLDGVFDLDYETATYSEGSIFYYYFNQNNVGWVPTSKNDVSKKLQFEFNQSYLDVNSNTVNAETSTIVYDKTSQTYIGNAELTSGAMNRFSYTIQSVLDGKAPAKVNSMKIQVVFDKFGNFKSINYLSNLYVEVYHTPTSTTMYATINANFTESFLSTGSKPVSITKPSAIK